jgi:hypothetical protein
MSASFISRARDVPGMMALRPTNLPDVVICFFGPLRVATGELLFDGKTVNA